MSKRQSVLLDQLRGSMPEDVKYVTAERQENCCALNIFFLVGEKWRVARKVDYETIYCKPELFWDAVEGDGEVALTDGWLGPIWSIDIEDTDDEPPKRWAAANDVAQDLLRHFKLSEEFCRHVGWLDPHIARVISLQEQEELSGKILEFIKPLLMKEADAPFPRRLPLPTVACSECGAGVEVHRHDDPKGSISFDGHLEHRGGHSLVRCYNCPPKIGPIKCDSGPVESTEAVIAKIDAVAAKLEAKLKADGVKVTWTGPMLPEKPENASGGYVDSDGTLGDGETASGGCTCGAWVTPGARHDGYCKLAE